MALKVFILHFLLFAQTAAAATTASEVADPVSDYINKAVLCGGPKDEQILRYMEGAKLWLSTDYVVGMKVGNWQLYLAGGKHFTYSGSEDRINGDWIWKVERCPCSEATKHKCSWQKWRKP